MSQQAVRAVIKAASRRGLKVSDESPRVIAGAVSGVRRLLHSYIPKLSDDMTTASYAVARSAFVHVMTNWKRLLGMYPTLERTANHTRINDYLSPYGIANMAKNRHRPTMYAKVIMSLLDTIELVFARMQQ